MRWGMIGDLFGMGRGRADEPPRYGREHRPDGSVVEFPMGDVRPRIEVIEEILSRETAVLDPEDAPNLAQVVAKGLEGTEARNPSICEHQHLKGLVVELRDRLALRAQVISKLEEDLRKERESNALHWKHWAELCTALGALINEVNCRHQHGIKEGTGEAHLQYVEARLKSIRERYHVPF